MILFGLWLGACGGSSGTRVCPELCVRRDNVIVRLVDDATGEPVKTAPGASGVFEIDGSVSSGDCVAPDPNGQSSCSNIGFDVGIGDHTVVIQPMGYQPASVDAKLTGPDDVCCPQSRSNIVDVTVRLKKQS